jgi:ATPase subunit of ABC transporter with duplicated ATPase domains
LSRKISPPDTVTVCCSRAWPGTLLLVTHDRRMLEAVHTTRRLNIAAGRVTEQSPTQV